MSANYVARAVGYHMTGGWGQGDRATNERFRPLETFAERFDEILRDVRALGFEAVDIWTSHLNPAWATPDHLAITRQLLDDHGLIVTTLAGWFGSNREEFEASCRMAAAIGTEVLGGSTSMLEKDRPFVLAALDEHGVRLGLENHPEKGPVELLAKIGEGAGGAVGATVDTGWFGTQGFDAADAIETLGDLVIAVHLKDVRAAGAHDTCRYGQGIVPIERCLHALRKIGYRGAICVEHEPETFDPSDDCRANLAMLSRWLTAAG